jgi:hypothetical protein
MTAAESAHTRVALAALSEPNGRRQGPHHAGAINPVISTTLCG